MAIHRVTAEWAGFQGAPGYTSFFFANEADVATATESRARVLAFFVELTAMLPDDLTVTPSTEVANIDQETGLVTDFVQVDLDPVPVIGTSPSGYSAASGAVVNWNTAGVRNGRRVRGRTFIVPMAGTAYDNAGTLSTAALNALSSAASELVDEPFASTFGVWSRPTNGANGAFWECNGYRVVDRVSVLRSRRD